MENLNKDEKELENASTSEDEELENEELDTGSPDDDSDSEELVGSEEEEENQDEPRKSKEDFAKDLERAKKRLGGKLDKERGRRVKAERQIEDVLNKVDELVDNKIRESEKRILRGQIEAMADKMASSDEERELILFHFDNDIVPSGNLAEDLDKAHALANRKRVSGQISELKKASSSKQNRIPNSGPGAPKKVNKQQQYSQEIIDAAKFAGVSPEEFVKKQE